MLSPSASRGSLAKRGWASSLRIWLVASGRVGASTRLAADRPESVVRPI